MTLSLPARNLPGKADPWGRELESRLRADQSSQTTLSQKVDNGLRATSGAIASSSAQAREMYYRQTKVVTMPNQTISVTTTPSWVSSAVFPEILRPEFAEFGLSTPPRKGLASLSLNIAGGNINTMYNAYLRLTYDKYSGSEVLWSTETLVGATGSAPADWVNQSSVYISAPVITDLSGYSVENFTLDFGGSIFGTNPTLRFTDITLTFTYSGLV